MTAIIRWIAPGEIVTDLSDRVDNGAQPRFSVTANAEECSVGTSSIVVRDEDGDFHIVGLNAANIEEDDSIAADPYIWAGRFGTRTEERGRYLTGASRDIAAELQDINTIASNYIAGDTEDADRPEESHEARMAWVAATMPNIDDDSLVIITSSVTMPEYDYTGMSWQQVIDDCARASGYQSFIYYDGANDLRQLVYAESGGTWLTTDLRITNLIADVLDDETGLTFFGADLRLEWDPSRVASRVYGRGDSIDAFRTNSATEVLHARRDVAMDFPTVRTQAVLEARMDRALANDLDTETRTLKGSVELPSTHASMFRAGMRFACHATHLSGFQEDFAYVRLLMTNHTLLTPTRYKVEFEAEPAGEGSVDPVSCEGGEYAPTATGTYDPTNGPDADADAVVYYIRFGDAQPFEPDPDYTGNPNFPEYGAGGSPDYMGDCAGNTVRVMVVGAGTLVVSTTTYGGSPRNITANLQHYDEGVPGPVSDDVQSGVTGDDFTFEVSTHDGAECIHWVDISDTGVVCGGKFGFAGADWTSSE